MEKPQLATWLLWGVFCFLKNVTPHKEKKIDFFSNCSNLFQLFIVGFFLFSL